MEAYGPIHLLSFPPQKTYRVTQMRPFKTDFFPDAYLAEVEWAIVLVHKEIDTQNGGKGDKKDGKADKKSDAPSARTFQPTIFGVRAALPFAAAVATVLAGIFIL